VIAYDNKIYIPQSLRKRILVVWRYHKDLQNPGITGREVTLRQNLIWPNFKTDVEPTVKSCHECQIGKKVRKKYDDDLPDKLAERPVAWNIVDIDLIGPLKSNYPSGKKELIAFTMIYPSASWFEAKDVNDKSAKESMNNFDDAWLSR
jgi:hypothetical protein